MAIIPTQLSGGMDPTGNIYERDGSIYRSISPEFIPFVKSLLDNKNIQETINHRFVDTSIYQENTKLNTLTLKHKKILPVNYPYEWSNQMLQDAARLTLDICLELLDEGFILKDATPWNIVFESCNPVFVDFTSIMPVEADLYWVALDQFLRLFLFPLLAAENGFGRVNRSLFLTSQNGLSGQEISHYLPAFSWLRKPWLINRLYIPRAMVNLLQSTDQDKEIEKLISISVISPEKRKIFFKGLLSEVNSIKSNDGDKEQSRYNSDMASFFDPQRFNQKQSAISKLLLELKPKSVVSIGCKKGGYAILAAQMGIPVTAFDTNENSLDLLYQTAKLRNLNILPLIMDITNPTPPSGWRASQYSSAIDRLKGEGALAVTQVHSLAITQCQPFKRIVKEFSDYCEKWLITEFIPIEDPRAKELLLTNRRDLSWYTLEGFLSELNLHFKEVTTFESYPKGRTLIFCRK